MRGLDHLEAFVYIIVMIKTGRVYVCSPESQRASHWTHSENWENENSTIKTTRSVSTSDNLVILRERSLT